MRKSAISKIISTTNKNIKEYFKGRPDKLLVINVAKKASYGKLMEFLDIDSPYDEFPWENRTR